MELTDKRILVTRGAGFVSSHPAETLIENKSQVVLVDDISNGQKWVPDRSELIVADHTDPYSIAEVVVPSIDIVFHFAARKDRKDENPHRQFTENTATAHHLLELYSEVDVDGFAYVSSSTIYEEASRPTPEDYAPLEPISASGAGKLGEEGLVSTYAHSHGLNGYVFSFENVVSPRLRGAVIPDFIEKLRADPEQSSGQKRSRANN